MSCTEPHPQHITQKVNHIMSDRTYAVIRFFRDSREREVIKTGLTREEATAHCADAKSSGAGWFDGFEEE